MLILAFVVLVGVNIVITKQVSIQAVRGEVNVADQLLAHKYPGDWRKEGDRLYKGDLLINNNSEIIGDIVELTRGTATIFADSTRVATNVKREDATSAIGSKVDKKIAKIVLEDGKNYYGKADVVGENYYAAYQPIKNKKDEIIGMLYVGTSSELVKPIIKKIFWLIVIIFIVSQIVIQALLIIPFNRLLFNPLDRIIKVTNQIAVGKLNNKLETEREDEIGVLIDSVNKMTNSLRGIVVSLLGITEDLSGYSQELAASAEEGNANIEDTNSNIEQIASGIQQVSASSQEVNGLAEEANAQTQVGNDNISKVINNIEEINQAVSEAVEVINALDDNSKEIGQIIEVITNIAEQTNLLALNAAIEAARAGEHGQGFAVVADEIRELAEETAKATDNIAGIVKETQSKSTKGLEVIKDVEVKAKEGKVVVQDTGEVFDLIRDAIESTSIQIEQTASISEQLAGNSNRLMNASEDISNMSHGITESSQELSNMAQQLQQMMEEFEI